MTPLLHHDAESTVTASHCSAVSPLSMDGGAAAPVHSGISAAHHVLDTIAHGNGGGGTLSDTGKHVSTPAGADVHLDALNRQAPCMG
jgi:hypothetical protein